MVISVPIALRPGPGLVGVVHHEVSVRLLAVGVLGPGVALDLLVVGGAGPLPPLLLPLPGCLLLPWAQGASLKYRGCCEDFVD